MKKILIGFLLLAFLAGNSQNIQLIGSSDNLNTVPGNLKIIGTGNTGITTGTTGQRQTAYTGATRFNTDSSRIELYNGTVWRALSFAGEGGSGTSITPGGSTGYIQYNRAGVAFGGSANFFYDTANVRVGIGTTSPLTPLHITRPDGIVLLQSTSTSGYSGMTMIDAAGVTSASVFWGNSAVSTAAQRNNLCLGARTAAGQLIFFRGTSLVEMGRFDASGNLSLQNNFSMLAASSAAIPKITDSVYIDGASNPYIGLKASGVTKGYAPILATGAGAGFNGVVAGDMAFRSEANKIHFGIGSGNSPTMTIASTTQVGIGIIVPTAVLHIRSGSTSQSQLRLQGSVAPTSPNNGDIWYDSVTTRISARIAGVTKRLDNESSPIVVAGADLTAQSAATNIVTYTTGAADSTFEVGARLNITAITTGTLQVQVTYFDENNVSRTVPFFSMGSTTAGISAIGYNNYAVLGELRVKASTTITVSTFATVTLVGATYNAGATIKKVR